MKRERSLDSNNCVTLHNVDKVYLPNYKALRGINLNIERGEFVFVAGTSGAGKSSFLRLIFGEEQATRGNVLILGRNMSNISSDNLSDLRTEIGVIFQDYKLLPSKNVLENVTFALESLGVRSSERNRRAMMLLEAVGLADRAEDSAMSLSGGEQQRVAIARALINRPKLIIADEPTGNLDPDMTISIFNLLIEANNCGATVIVASHNLQLIEELNKRTIVLEKGRLIGDFRFPKGVADDEE